MRNLVNDDTYADQSLGRSQSATGRPPDMCVIEMKKEIEIKERGNVNDASIFTWKPLMNGKTTVVMNDREKDSSL